MDSKKLPSEIEIKIKKEKNGVIFAELNDFGIFTEANNYTELIVNVNDLIYSFFDIENKNRGKFWYLPPFEDVETKQQEMPRMNPLLFHIFTRPGKDYRMV